MVFCTKQLSDWFKSRTEKQLHTKCLRDKNRHPSASDRWQYNPNPSGGKTSKHKQQLPYPRAPFPLEEHRKAASPVVSDIVEKAIAVVDHGNHSSLDSKITNQTCWENEVAASSTVCTKKRCCARLKEVATVSEELQHSGKKKLIGQVTKHYILLPSGEEWVCEELWNRETFLFCYEWQT